MIFVVIAFVGYILGSIPFGFLVAKCAGVDIRAAGSGNIGATNVVRTLGKAYGYPVFLLDFLKGFGAVKIAILIASRSTLAIPIELAGIVAGICSVIGHSYPVWLRFKGGKGVATSAGVVFGLMPLVALIAGVIWILVFLIGRYVSLASIIAAIALPISCAVLLWFGHLRAPVLLYFSILLALVVVARHRTNISRLRSGRELRFERK